MKEGQTIETGSKVQDNKEEGRRGKHYKSLKKEQGMTGGNKKEEGQRQKVRRKETRKRKEKVTQQLKKYKNIQGKEGRINKYKIFLRKYSFQSFRVPNKVEALLRTEVFPSMSSLKEEKRNSISDTL